MSFNGQCAFLVFIIALSLAEARGRIRVRPRGRQLELQQGWDGIELKKLSDSKEMSNDTKAKQMLLDKTDNLLEERQLYPEVPVGGPAEGEVPRPLPTRPPSPVGPALGCLGARGQFPSPNNCANYLNCWDDTVIEQQCPLGLLFNDLSNVCDFDYNVNCGPRPGPTPKPSLQPESKYCPDTNGRYRSATNCSEFYVCLAGQPIKFHCPLGLVYNDEYGVCDYVYNVNCGTAVTPSPPPPSPSPPSSSTEAPRPTTQSSTRPPVRPGTRPPQQAGYPSPAPPSYPPAYPPQPAYPQPQAQVVAGEKGSDDSTIVNPWDVPHDLPIGLANDTPCVENEIRKLDDFCTSVVVCRNRRHELVQCPKGFTYDKPSDSCKHFTIAKC